MTLFCAPTRAFARLNHGSRGVARPSPVSAVALRIWSCPSILLLFLVCANALAEQNPAGKSTGADAGGLRHGVLRGVSDSKVFTNINRNDARAALKVWFDLVGRQSGFLLDSRVDIVDGVAEIKERLQNHTVELVTVDSADFLGLESSHLLTPVLTDARSSPGGPLSSYSYLLLVKPPPLGPTSIAGLRGKNVLVWSRGGGATGLAWLEVLLGKEKLGRASSFFASVKSPEKAQACILPLFFGAADACLVDEINLSLAKEMNPQLGQLNILARSRPMIESVVAVPSEPHPFQKELIDAMLSLHESLRGRQLLMVFKTDRLVRIQPGDLDSTRELWRDYDRITGSAGPHRPGGSGPVLAAERERY